MSFFSFIFGDANARAVRALQPVVEAINALEPSMQALSAAELRGLTVAFRARLEKGESLDDLLPEAFAAVREASVRVSGKRHFDVQLMGGMVLHQGKIAQMSTGEGKTLTATLAVYLNALAGKGVHVVTVNDYLSRRDATWMGQIYHALGVTVGVLNHEASYRYDPAHVAPTQQESLDAERDATGSFRVVHEFLRPVERREAYAADITYGTNNEFGFDYLRDNMVLQVEAMAQRPEDGHHFAIVDEVDSILIDEARTPLIISSPDEESGALYNAFARVAPHLKEGDDYNIDEKRKTVSITDAGIDKVQERMGIADIYAEGGTRYVHHLEQALRAQVFYRRDKEYVVKDGEVIIVDEFTGRLMPGRRWSDGLHQAVEAKEGVAVQRESRTLATVTFQNYFRKYTKLSGMTGTARTSAEEFHKVYQLDVVAVPTNKPMVRQDLPDRVYKTEEGKFRALAAEIKRRHEGGQPVLVGTVSIEKNELLSHMLTRSGVRHQVLNAKNHEREAEIISQAGRLGAVTVATNMAGRGVDIILGGNPPDEAEAARVRELGGLCVFGTERHEARRIDDQLRGRAGRQGDPGTSQFYVSTQDELIRIFGGDRLTNTMDRLGVTDEDVIENRIVSGSIAQAQSRVEGHNFDGRKYVLEYDDVMNKHRETVYGLRRAVLMTPDNKDRVLAYLDEQFDALVRAHVNAETGDWDLEEIAEAVRAIAPFDASLHRALREKADDASWQAGDPEELIAYLQDEADRLYAAHEKRVGASQLRAIETAVIVRTIDSVWVDHIEAMEHLRESVQLRAFGQRDPLVEYKIESQRMYAGLLGTVAARVAGIIFKVQIEEPVQSDERRVVQEGRAVAPDAAGDQAIHHHSEDDPAASDRTIHSDNIGRNDPCPCGSGKKF
ncbi:MAG: preprotein translocase subunit SecA, partial [Candidatus Yanofskybacteria bacterium]|nr:preprotein translocase subunit SecA [Candidatus Yanofskybacteria bacterium]